MEKKRAFSQAILLEEMATSLDPNGVAKAARRQDGSSHCSTQRGQPDCAHRAFPDGIFSSTAKNSRGCHLFLSCLRRKGSQSR